MSENIETAAVEITDRDLYTGPEIEETPEMVLLDIVQQIVGSKSEYTAFAVATIVNKIFKATGTAKEIPTQMMYTYSRNGLVAKRTKGMPGSEVRYTREEVMAWVTKYTAKYIEM
jgi:hypothetical protein